VIAKKMAVALAMTEIPYPAELRIKKDPPLSMEHCIKVFLDFL